MCGLKNNTCICRNCKYKNRKKNIQQEWRSLKLLNKNREFETGESIS